MNRVFIFGLVILVISFLYIHGQQTQAKPNISSSSKLIQDLKKKVATLLAPCLYIGNGTNPDNLLQCQAALSELETFEETLSAKIAGFKALIQQILRNIH